MMFVSPSSFQQPSFMVQAMTNMSIIKRHPVPIFQPRIYSPAALVQYPGYCFMTAASIHSLAVTTCCPLLKICPSMALSAATSIGSLVVAVVPPGNHQLYPCYVTQVSYAGGRCYRGIPMKIIICGKVSNLGRTAQSFKSCIQQHRPYRPSSPRLVSG